MTLRDRLVAALGGVPRSVHRQTLQAETRAVNAGQAFAAGVEDVLAGHSGISLARYREPAYSGHSFAHACMRTVAQAFAQVRFGLWKKEAGNTPQDVPDAPLLELLDNPYPELYASGLSFRYQMALYWLASGNCWLWLDVPENSRRGTVPRAIAVFGARQVKPLRDTQTGRLQAWELTLGQTRRVLPPDGLVHIKFPVDPDSGDLILGVGPLQAAQHAVDADYASLVWNAAFFRNGARIGTVLSYDPQRPGDSPWLTPEQRAQLKQGLIEDHQGAERAHGVHVLQGPFKLQQLGVSQKDMDFLALRKFSREEIAAVFGVPVVLVNGFENAGLGREGVAVAQKLLYENTIVPMVKIVEAVWQRVLVDRYAPGLVGEFALDELPALREDEERKSQIAHRYWSMGIPVNDIIDKLNLAFDKVPWGDEWWVPGMQIPASQLVNGSPEPAPALPAPAAPVAPVPPEPTRALAPPAQPIRQSEERLARWRAFVDTFQPVEDKAFRRVRRHIVALRWEVLRNLDTVLGQRTVRTVEDDLRRILFDELAADATLRALLRPLLLQGVRIGVNGAAAELGVVPLALEAPAVQATVALKAIKVVQINDTIRDALRETLLDGFDAGETIADLAARIRSVFNASAGRARTIARTEISGAVNGGRYVELREEGVQRHAWLCVAGDVRVVGPGVSHIARRWYDGQWVELRTIQGRILTVTADHQLLTRRGWLAAHDVVQGDDLLCYQPETESTVRMVPHVEDMPTTIAELFASAHEAAASRGMVMRVMNLDRERRKGEVDVINVDGELRDRLQPSGSQRIRQRLFVLSDFRLGALLLAGGTAQFPDRGTVSPGSQQSSVTLSRFAALSAHSHPPSFRVGSDNRATETDRAPNDCAGSFPSPSKYEQRIARDIFLGYDRCVSVNVVTRACHAYDLTTATGWMIANGLIVHNSAGDEQVRERHGGPLHTMDGETVALGEPFSNGLRFPLDPEYDGADAAELIINCRCTTTVEE